MTARRCECERCQSGAVKVIYGVRVCERHEDEVRVNLRFLKHQEAKGYFAYLPKAA